MQDLYDESKQNYGAPKITRKLRQNGEGISERTVGKYMKEMRIKSPWVKQWTITTIDSDFSGGSDIDVSGGVIPQPISTHAPLTGSDAPGICRSSAGRYFNSRSPHGERRCTVLM